MAKIFPLNPKHPERICWGCDRYCAVDSLQCGNGSGRTQHPAELLGDDWYEHGDWGLDPAMLPEKTADQQHRETSQADGFEAASNSPE